MPERVIVWCCMNARLSAVCKAQFMGENPGRYQHASVSSRVNTFWLTLIIIENDQIAFIIGACEKSKMKNKTKKFHLMDV